MTRQTETPPCSSSSQRGEDNQYERTVVRCTSGRVHPETSSHASGALHTTRVSDDHKINNEPKTHKTKAECLGAAPRTAVSSWCRCWLPCYATLCYAVLVLLLIHARRKPCFAWARIVSTFVVVVAYRYLPAKLFGGGARSRLSGSRLAPCMVGYTSVSP